MAEPGGNNDEPGVAGPDCVDGWTEAGDVTTGFEEGDDDGGEDWVSGGCVEGGCVAEGCVAGGCVAGGWVAEGWVAEGCAWPDGTSVV